MDGVAVLVGVTDGVAVLVGVAVIEGVAVLVGVRDGVAVLVGVIVGVIVGVKVGVLVGVTDGGIQFGPNPVIVKLADKLVIDDLLIQNSELNPNR
jgi:hypothetical protein